MEKPHAQNIAKKSAAWNQLIPKCQTYAGTSVSEIIKVPMRKQLIGQLTFSKGMWRNILALSGGRRAELALAAGGCRKS